MKAKRRDLKADKIRLVAERDEEYDRAWPQKPPKAFCLTRCAEYRKATTYTTPRPCACCARARNGVKLVSIRGGQSSTVPECYNRLRSPTVDTSYFTFEFCPALDDLMLYCPALVEEYDGENVCAECDSALHRDRIPRFALANDLYRSTGPASKPDTKDDFLLVYDTDEQFEDAMEEPSEPKTRSKGKGKGTAK